MPQVSLIGLDSKSWAGTVPAVLALLFAKIKDLKGLEDKWLFSDRASSNPNFRVKLVEARVALDKTVGRFVDC